MDPRIQQQLLEAAARTDNPAVRREIISYVLAGGKAPLSPEAEAVVSNVQQSPQAAGAPGINTPGTAQGSAQGSPQGRIAGGPLVGGGGTLDEGGPSDAVSAAAAGGGPARLRLQQAGLPNVPAAGGGAEIPAVTQTANSGNPFNAREDSATGGMNSGDIQRFIAKAMGLDPRTLGRSSRHVINTLLPLVQARRNAFALSGDADSGMTQDLLNFIQSSGQKGGNFFGAAQQYGQQAMQNPMLQAALSNMGIEEQQAAMRSLQPLLFAGYNPMIQHAVGAATENMMGEYNDQERAFLGQRGPQPNNIFSQFVAQSEDPLVRRIFGGR